MLSDAQILTVQVASSSEPTPELASFWSAKYRELYLQKVFFLDQATEELVARELPVKEYLEPRGYVNLPEHITSGRLDEEKFARTVGVAVRYLDDLIDTLEFSERAQKVAENYRALKLSVQGLERYLDQVRPLSVHAEIQKVAEHLARAAYRASESLAEEKGTCTSWLKYRKPPRIKVFDLLYNEETEEVKDALSVGLDTSLEGSAWEVYQRRNLTLLDLPKNSSWEAWDDYAEPKVVEATESLRRTPTRAVEVNVHGDKIATMAEALNSSPYKKLFSSLLNEENQEQEPKPTEVATDLPTAQPSEESVNRGNPVKPAPVYPAVHIVFGNDTHGQVVTRSGEVLSDVIARYCRDGTRVHLLHATTAEGQVHLLYTTGLENSLLRLDAELRPYAELQIPGIDLLALLPTKALRREQSPASVPTAAAPAAEATTAPQVPQPPAAKPILTQKPPSSPKRRPSRTKTVPPRQDTYRVDTKYFGRVEVTVYTQGGRIQRVRGSLRYRSELTTAVFGILQDVLQVMQQEYIPVEEMRQNLRRKIYGETDPRRRKVLTLVQVLLELVTP